MSHTATSHHSHHATEAAGVTADVGNGTSSLRWGNERLQLEISWRPEVAPWLSCLWLQGRRVRLPGGLPLIEVLTAAHGHRFASSRLVHTCIGTEARYRGHEEERGEGWAALTLRVGTAGSGIESSMRLIQYDGAGAVRAEVTVVNTGRENVVLRAVPSFTAQLGLGGSDRPHWILHEGHSDWLAEGRWRQTNMPGELLPDIAHELTGQEPRGEYSLTSHGTWSTGKHLPIAAAVSRKGALDASPESGRHAGVESGRNAGLETTGPRADADAGLAWLWQIEHNGPWRWEVGHNDAGDYLSLSGPTHADHDWLQVLAPGERFTSVPVAVAAAAGLDCAVAELTAYRRSARREHPDNAALPVIFNDYMNTINGDPTTEKLLPLVDAAAEVGAEIFCIDAGWYDESGDWWDSVGQWLPSTTRFPGGLDEVIDRIHARGMRPGLWLELEVVGVNSPLAQELPPEAFLQLAGTRVVEHHRYHLDLRHRAARDHLNGVVDRLVQQFGIGYFKFDYNINPGAGSDRETPSTGAALLEHNRAHLGWLDGLHERYPDLVIENCGSGAMRSDWAMLSRLQLQSTSDQQDFRKYPPIAVSAPMVMLPEQAANWAYPQPGMSREEVSFCLVTGLLGRFFLSGHLNELTDQQHALVRQAMAVAKEIRGDIRRAVPFWPLGLPGWEDSWVALGLATSEGALLAVWNRDPEQDRISLPIGRFAPSGASIATLFPHGLQPWQSQWDPSAGVLELTNTTGTLGARVFRIHPAAAQHQP